MFLKTIGMAFILAGFGGWGLMGAHRIERRVKQISHLKLALAFLEKEITYMQTPLSGAMNRTAQFIDEPIKHLFRDVAARLERKRGVTAGEAWIAGLNGMPQYSDLESVDMELLARIAPQLGMSNVDEQKKIFGFVQEELKLMEEKALKESESNRKMWSYGGFILGAVVILLLL